MITRFLKFIYKNTPRFIINIIGRSDLLHPLRKLLLYKDGSKRLLTVTAHWDEQSFLYTGGFKSAIKAERKGIESSLLRLSIRLLKEVKHKENNAIVFDVGSSYGYLSTVWAITACIRGKVYGFEANQSVFETAVSTAIKNMLTERIQYNHCAVYNKDGILKMNMHDGTHASLSVSGSRNNITQVKSITLDTFCRDNDIFNIDLIKIDVDGPEWEVLMGAKQIIHLCKPILIVESNGDERIMPWLRSCGYNIFDLSMINIQVGAIPPPNIVAIPG